MFLKKQNSVYKWVYYQHNLSLLSSWDNDNVCHPLFFTTNEERNLLSVWTLPHQVSPTLKTTQSASAEAEHIWTHMSMHIHRYTQIHIHSPTYIHIHKCTHTQRDMLKHTYCDTCAHTHIYICSHTYTHTHITFLNFCFIHHRCFHYVNLSRTNLIHYSSYGWQDHFKYLKNASHFLVATLRAVFCMFSFIHVIYFYNFSILPIPVRSSTCLPTHIDIPTQHNVLPVKKEDQNQTNEQKKSLNKQSPPCVAELHLSSGSWLCFTWQLGTTLMVYFTWCVYFKVKFYHSCSIFSLPWNTIHEFSRTHSWKHF